MTAREDCPGCGGTGQVSYFKGVSRFLLSCEECPECAGLGIRLVPAAAENPGETGKGPPKTRSKKKPTEKRS
jgi:ssDNA-binding Zn-finger/Zn-ribbon topoisomerase 1